jgi:phosphatidate cytidylyltransferase
MLRLRVLSAVVIIPVVFALVYVGGLPWLAGVLFAGVLGWREMVLLLKRGNFTLDQWLGLFFVVGALVEAYISANHLLQFDLLRPMLAGLIIFSLVWALYYKGENATANWGITVASALYLGFMLGHMVSLRERPDGMRWVYVTFLLAFTCDAMAFFVGSALGKHKMWPRISPKKSWEGLVGGSAATMFVGPFLAYWLLGLSPWLGLVLGALVAAADPFGDFAVSLFKRMANSKDSSQLIPGHGGALDRLDSLLFIFPVVTYFALVVAGP